MIVRPGSLPTASSRGLSAATYSAYLFISYMSEASPERSTAAHYGDSMGAGLLSVGQTRGPWIALEPTVGGWGGRIDSDGESGLINL